jgi:hypothetical protein
MLKTLKIKNFQSHADTVFDLHPGVNLFLAVSNTGKSAALRAVLKLWKNRPLGTRVKSRFAKGSPTSITAVLDNNDEVSLEIGTSSTYRVVRQGKISEFKSFGSDTPDLIASALDLDDINIATQLEKHYMITDSAPEVSRKFNTITRIEQVDKWVSKLTSKINAENATIRALEADVQKLEHQIFEFADLEKLEELVSQSEYLTGLEIQKQKAYEALLNLINLYKEVVNRIQDLTSVLSTFETSVNELSDLQIEFNTLERKYGDLYNYLIIEKDLTSYNNLLKVEVYLNKLMEVRDTFKKKEALYNLLKTYTRNENELRYSKVFLSLEPTINTIDTLITDYTIVCTDVKDISDYINQIKKKDVLLADWHQHLSQSTNTLEVCLNIVGRCPFCFESITPEKINKIVEEL